MFLKKWHTSKYKKTWEEFDLFEKIADNNLWQALPYLRLSSCGQSDLYKRAEMSHCNTLQHISTASPSFTMSKFIQKPARGHFQVHLAKANL